MGTVLDSVTFFDLETILSNWSKTGLITLKSIIEFAITAARPMFFVFKKTLSTYNNKFINT